MALLPRCDLGKDGSKDLSSQLKRPRREMCHLCGLRRPAKRIAAGYPAGQVPNRRQERWQGARGRLVGLAGVDERLRLRDLQKSYPRGLDVLNALRGGRMKGIDAVARILDASLCSTVVFRVGQDVNGAICHQPVKHLLERGSNRYASGIFRRPASARTLCGDVPALCLQYSAGDHHLPLFIS
jgi:hypothetical protein